MIEQRLSEAAQNGAGTNALDRKARQIYTEKLTCVPTEHSCPGRFASLL